MAKIGLRNPIYKAPNNSGVIGKAVSADFTFDFNDEKYYGDDIVAEIDSGFTGGTLTLETTDISPQVKADLLGKVLDGGVYVSNIDDQAPFVSIGINEVQMVDGERKFRAIWIHRVKFTEPNVSAQTKQDRVAFTSPSIEGAILPDDNGNWKTEQLFDTYENAKTWLYGLAELEEQVAKPVASIKGGTYGETKSVALASATSGTTIYYTTNGLTPTTDSDEYTNAISITASTMLKAIAVKAGMKDSFVMEEEYIITT